MYKTSDSSLVPPADAIQQHFEFGTVTSDRGEVFTQQFALPPFSAELPFFRGGETVAIIEGASMRGPEETRKFYQILSIPDW